MRLIFKTSSVTPDYLYVFIIILSFSICSQSFKKICTWKIWALVSLRHFRCHRNYWYCMVKRDLLLLYCKLCSWKYALITCTLSSFRDFLPFDMLRIKYKSQTLAWTKTKVWLTRALCWADETCSVVYLWYSNSMLNLFLKYDLLPMISVHQSNGIPYFDAINVTW